MAATSNLAGYAASTAATITIAALPSSATLLAGAEGAAIDNTSNKYLDYLIAGKVRTGTAPTAGTIGVYVVGIMDDTHWPDVFDGVAGALTVTSSDIKNAICMPVIELVTDATTGRDYPFGPVSVAGLFGGFIPKQFIIFVSHSTVAALDATAANHAIYLTGLFSTGGN